MVGQLGVGGRGFSSGGGTGQGVGDELPLMTAEETFGTGPDEVLTLAVADGEAVTVGIAVAELGQGGGEMEGGGGL